MTEVAILLAASTFLAGLVVQRAPGARIGARNPPPRKRPISASRGNLESFTLFIPNPPQVSRIPACVC